MTDAQGDEMALVWRGCAGIGILDYVSAWYEKASRYIAGTRIRVAFVSTNSITQGEQPGVLWPDLFRRGIKIHFAHRTFPWKSEARGAAHVHVVIIGFGAFDTTNKQIYEYDEGAGGAVTLLTAANISPYLVEGADFALTARSEPLCPVPPCVYGSKPVDGGHLILDQDHYADFVAAFPDSRALIRPLLCNVEYLNGIQRWCLWLVDVAPERFRHIDGVRDRISGVRAFRLASRKESTRRKAESPALFAEIRQPTSEFVVIPLHTSEVRRYIPFGYFSADNILHNSCSAIANASRYHFGVISSLMHMAWVRAVCGRIKSDFRYSTTIVYNNFPWPTDAPAGNIAAVEDAAGRVLEARALFLPPEGASTLADLYDPLTMPDVLVRVHNELDRAVDRCYRPEPFRTDRERVEHLFSRYERLIDPLFPRNENPRGRRRTTIRQ